MSRVFLALVVFASSLTAQQRDTTRGPQDSLIQRAKKLLDDGKAADGRRLLDSVMKVSPPESALYVEALYWRAATAAAAVDAERDYRRLLIEAPLSARAEDGMLQLAQLEQARGDRRGATEHFQRFILSYPKNPARPRVAVSLVRLLFEQGQVTRGCDALRMGREAVAENLELRNQLEFYAPRCVVFDVSTAGASTDSGSSARDSTTRIEPAPAVPKPATAPASTARNESSFYSVQVAAYDSPEPATRMSRMLKSRGLEARVDGKGRPYRVRVGKYTTRAEAVKAAAALKSQGIGGFVALAKSDR